MEALNKRLKRELIDQNHFSTAHEAETAIGNWVEHYNYKRTHQGIGGFLVPAERFHGQAEQVLAAVAEGIDVTDHKGYNFSGIERSVVNLMLSPGGKLTLYVVGRPIVLKGADHGK